ncbi:hypothetical protein [Propylenella binzhouense]|uniref:Uncharacterized protein n=1 Tax=Propylenella binzhouense TaxID=2555902 RepID=A0A964T5F5_9HYPH|nr:hypothetical protein [Propylenella binzhouense]MYZ48164.1 hypothetical protein [Propylenella binzhouense]
MRARAFVRTVLRASAVALGPVLLAGCVTSRFGPVQEARTALVGLNENEMRLCAGFPSKRYEQNTLEIWSYEKTTASSVGVSLPVLPTIVGASMNVNGGGDCRMQVVFQNGKVTRIGYSGANDSISGRYAFCAPMVAECVRFAREKAGGGKGIPGPPRSPESPEAAPPGKPVAAR